MDDPNLDAAEAAARATFGFEALRPEQRAVLGHVLAGRHCLAVMPTGSGKSYCYALPALLRPGLVLVVSPLIALMRDQARRFAEAGVPCAHLDSLQTDDERRSRWHELESGRLRLLIVSPERLARPAFRARLRGLPLQLVAIDEAHCISQWGSHFRPDYRFLGQHLAELGPVPTLAVTATATARVRADICASLGLGEPATVQAAFARANLRLKVVRADKVHEQLTAVLQAVLASSGSGIVYVPTRKSARDIHRMLVDAGVAAAVYHAGMPPPARAASQADFMSGRARVVVATHAFGLGIDKADIRFVHHAGVPQTLEQYVQEFGRAGRDGLPADCWLIYGPRDFHVQRFMLDKSYPEPAQVEAVYRCAASFIDGVVGEPYASVRQHVASQVAAPADVVDEALTVLCREGLLARLRARSASGPGDSGYDDELIGEGVAAAVAAAVLAEYPQRKRDALAKLEALRAYVAPEHDRLAFLDDYFGD